jgi:hypothetical protein
MARQLRRIVEVGSLPRVEVRLVAAGADVGGGADPFRILDFPELAGVGTLATQVFAGPGFDAEKAAEVGRFRRGFDDLLGRSMAADESLEVIGQAAGRLERRYLCRVGERAHSRSAG